MRNTHLNMINDQNLSKLNSNPYENIETHTPHDSRDSIYFSKLRYENLESQAEMMNLINNC